MPAAFLNDEIRIFTSPARFKRGDLRWILPLGAATAGAFATDTYVMRHVVSQSPSFNQPNIDTSEVLRDTAIGGSILMYVIGRHQASQQVEETGLLASQAMLDSYAFSEVVKYATLRERPYQDNARGHFFETDAVSNPSFISGHSIVVWSSAAVFAKEYHRPWQQTGVYAFASAVSLTRVLGQKHFPSDVLLGSAAGWLIGRYVYKKYHRVTAAGLLSAR